MWISQLTTIYVWKDIKIGNSERDDTAAADVVIMHFSFILKSLLFHNNPFLCGGFQK